MKKNRTLLAFVLAAGMAMTVPQTASFAEETAGAVTEQTQETQEQTETAEAETAASETGNAAAETAASSETQVQDTAAQAQDTSAAQAQDTSAAQAQDPSAAAAENSTPKASPASRIAAKSSDFWDYSTAKWTWISDSRAGVTLWDKKHRFKSTMYTNSVTQKYVQSPTCTEQGYKYLTASIKIDNKIRKCVKTVYIPALGHNYEDPQWTWSEDCSTASVTLKCSRCLDAKTVNATVKQNVLQDATCSQTGEIEYTAEAADETGSWSDRKTAAIPAVSHDWSNPQWTWSEDCSTAAVTLTCKNCGTEQTFDANVSQREIMPVTCTQNGKIRYTASYKDDKGTWVDQKTKTIPATGHDWSNPQWTWSEDCSTAAVTLTCKNCGTEQTFDANVSQREIMPVTCTQNGKIRYTASYKDDKGTWVDQKTKTIPATGHDWGDPQWTWSEDYSTASVVRVCNNNANHVETADAQITTEDKDGKRIYTATAVLDGETLTDTKQIDLPKDETENTGSKDEPTDTAGKTDGNDKTANTAVKAGASAKAAAVRTVSNTASVSKTQPKTGDGAAPVVWGGMLAAGAALTALAERRKKKAAAEK